MFPGNEIFMKIRFLNIFNNKNVALFGMFV
jgi:hypothetical protein